jgi:copper resistance protein D
LTDVFVWTRAVHFVAMISLAGTIVFDACVAEPALRSASDGGRMADLIRSRLTWIVWVSLAAAAISAAGWLVLLTARLSDLSTIAAVSGDQLWTVLSETDFGQIWAVRLLLMAVLATALFLHRSRPMRIVSIVVAASLVGTLAWAGHAAANMGSDLQGNAHLVGDILHLIAAAAWLGALVPLALMLGPPRDEMAQSLDVVRIATARFSILGVVSVGTIVVTGINNTWVLSGSVEALTGTEYGRLLLLKIALFGIMLALATVNRFRLTPRLVQTKAPMDAREAALQLRRNALLEALLGVLILIIVAALGTMSPGLEDATKEGPARSAWREAASNLR